MGVVRREKNISDHHDDVKETVYYHRAYRKMPVPDKKVYILFIVLVVLIDVVLYLYLSELTRIMSQAVQFMLAPALPDRDVTLVTREFLWKTVTMVDLYGSFPTKEFCFFTALVSLILAIVIAKTRIPRPYVVTIVVLCAINTISAIFFYFVPHRFPYRMYDFAALYTETEILMCFLIPVLYLLAMYPLPSRLITKVGLVLLALCYSIIFTTFRYAVFLFLIAQYSYLFMAVLFFCFGVLLDMFFIVGIYAYHVSVLSRRIKDDLRVWKWLY